MTRSSTKELFTPFKDLEPEFRSSRKHFKTLSLDESRSPDFDLFSDQEEYSEGEVTKTMAETMEQYMSKTRADYGSGVVRPKIEDKDSFELKGQFLKEIRDNTFSGSDHDDANEHIEKVLKIVDLFHIPNITIDQVILRAFLMSLTGAASRWLKNKPFSSITNWEDLKTKFLSKYCPPARTAKKIEDINNFQQEPDENFYQAWERFKELLMKCPQHYLTEMQEVVLFYNGLDVPTRQILDSRGAIPSKTTVDAKVAIQEMTEYSQKCHNGT
ncbi:retrovirus-related pol polyprotein from transposon TNT 1-94 [Tanacetum coccineum]